MNKKAVIYARVSTDEQAQTGYSLESQIEACYTYGQNHQLNVIEDIQDDYTGASLDRPGIDRVRTLVGNKEIDAVIVYSSDRWTRNLAHSLILREELLNAGIELHYVNRSKSEDTPESRMMDNIEGVFNEFWREKIIEACRRGKNTKAKNNRPVLSGITPYGYRRRGEGNKLSTTIRNDLLSLSAIRQN